jgi:ATP-binding cassette subfamily C protein
MILGAIFEGIGIGAVPIFISFLTQPSILNDQELLSNWLPQLPDEPTRSLILWASVTFFSFVLLKGAFLTLIAYLQSRIVSLQIARLSNRMFRAYQSAPYDWILQRSTSELMRNIQTDTAKVIGGVLMPVLDQILSITISIAVISIMIFATPTSTIISMGLVGIALVATIRLMRKQMGRIGSIARTESQRSIQSIQQGFGAIVDARIIGCEDHLANIHRGSAMRSAHASILNSTLLRVTPVVLEAVSLLGLLTALFFIIQSGETLASSLPALSIIGVALIRLKQMASKIATSANLINQSRPYIPGLLKDIAELDRLADRGLQKRSSARQIRDFATLKLDHVSYTYPNNKYPAVNNISLELKKGEAIALVGPTGCGKSTLVNLILGLLHAQKGNIFANGIDIEADPEGWRQCLGYIPQSIFLIDDSLRANIAFGMPENQIDETHLRTVLQSAALSEYVDSLPEGLDTVIGERGIRLSGGQRQRLGIARALYFNPTVLVLDEATSALDNKTEIEVMLAIQNLKKERTLIMIAHRLSTVVDCDRLYFLEAGQIKEAGTYQHLIEKSAAFRDMAAVTS